MATPMTRTLEVIKKDNLKYWIVEIYKTWAKRKVDLFNIIDLLVLDNGILGIQVTGSDFASHKTKIMEDEKENTFAWLSEGARLEVWGWRRLKKKRGKKAMFWAPRIADVLIVNKELYWEERK